MEVHFTPELEQKLNDLAGFFDDLTGTREMLDSRYDDIKNGRVRLIPGDEVFARLGE
jgi:hypothetical protein